MLAFACAGWGDTCDSGQSRRDIAITRNGAEGNRTPDLMLAKHALSQLSYRPGLRRNISVSTHPRNPRNRR